MFIVENNKIIGVCTPKRGAMLFRKYKVKRMNKKFHDWLIDNVSIEHRFNQLEQDIKTFADMKFMEVQESITKDFKQVREGLPLLFPRFEFKRGYFVDYTPYFTL